MILPLKNPKKGNSGTQIPLTLLFQMHRLNTHPEVNGNQKIQSCTTNTAESMHCRGRKVFSALPEQLMLTFKPRAAWNPKQKEQGCVCSVHNLQKL